MFSSSFQSMPKRRYPAGGVLGPNTVGGSNPQFGNIETLPSGLNRLASVIALYSINGKQNTWSRLTFNFPECLGIKQTLDNAAKNTQCIPSLDMDVNINIPIIRNVTMDIMYRRDCHTYTAHLSGDANDRLAITQRTTNFQMIMTGEDQLAKSVPDQSVQSKDDVLLNEFTALQNATASKCIWAHLDRAKGRATSEPSLQKVVNPGKVGWEYGTSSQAYVGLTYSDIAENHLGDYGIISQHESVRIDNIPKAGYKLLNDHVNVFFRTASEAPEHEMFEVRLLIDYETSSVPLSSLLVWRQQLTEFVPKQIQWRGFKQDPGATKENGWRVLISRGTVKETGAGRDPSDKTQFPNIAD